MRSALLSILVLIVIMGADRSAVADPGQTPAAPAASGPIRAAQTAIEQRRWRDARALIEHAMAQSGISGRDEYRLAELRAYVLYREHDTGAAATAYAQLLKSPHGRAAGRTQGAKTVAELYFQAGNYRAAVDYGEQYLRRHPGASAIAALVADADLRLRDYADSASTMRVAVQRAERDQQVPRQSWLRIAQDAYYAMGDTADETLMLKKLVLYYHRPEDWQALLELSARSSLARDSLNEPLEFGYLRLRYDLGLLADPDRYEALIFESLQAGMPAKARAVLEQAEKRGVFSPDRAQRLQRAINVRAIDPARRLSHALNEAQRDSTGASDAVAGRIYLGEDLYAKAIQAFQRSLNKGGLHDPDAIRLDMGIASLRNHQTEIARAAFGRVSPGSDWAKLAALWSLRLENRTSGIAS